MSQLYGIKCELHSPEATKVIRRVLRQIRDKCPADFERLQQLVLRIVPLSRNEAQDGTTAEVWRAQEPCEVEVWEKSITQDFAASIAHKFGHVCTRDKDLERRGAVPYEEWRAEMAADWYAYRWGFGRRIAKLRRNQDRTHRGPAPGEEYTVEYRSEGIGHKYRISRNFVGDLIEEFVLDTGSLED